MVKLANVSYHGFEKYDLMAPTALECGGRSHLLPTRTIGVLSLSFTLITCLYKALIASRLPK